MTLSSEEAPPALASPLEAWKVHEVVAELSAGRATPWVAARWDLSLEQINEIASDQVAQSKFLVWRASKKLVEARAINMQQQVRLPSARRPLAPDTLVPLLGAVSWVAFGRVFPLSFHQALRKKLNSLQSEFGQTGPNSNWLNARLERAQTYLLQAARMGAITLSGERWGHDRGWKMISAELVLIPPEFLTGDIILDVVDGTVRHAPVREGKRDQLEFRHVFLRRTDLLAAWPNPAPTEVIVAAPALGRVETTSPSEGSADDVVRPWDFQTGRPGRPTPSHLMIDEMKRRFSAGIGCAGVGAEARALLQWLGSNHPNAPQIKAKSAEAAIRSDFNKLRAAIRCCP